MVHLSCVHFYSLATTIVQFVPSALCLKFHNLSQREIRFICKRFVLKIMFSVTVAGLKHLQTFNVINIIELLNEVCASYQIS